MGVPINFKMSHLSTGIGVLGGGLMSSCLMPKLLSTYFMSNAAYTV